MPADLLLGIDLGAGSLKATLIRTDGTVAAEASATVTTLSPHPGWSEQDPAGWWAALVDAVPRAIAASGGGAGSILAISFSAGAHTQVLEDGDGRVIRPAILWNDQRSAAEAAALRAGHDARILEHGANRANPTWTLPQMLWLRHHEPESFARVRRMYLAKDWLRTRLTGGFETDTIDALGALMVDAARKTWSAELCGLIGWDMTTLPPIVEPTARAGVVTGAAAKATGLVAGTPVICGTSDTAIETFGAGMVRTGLGCVKLATAATVSVLSREPRVDRELINYYHVVPDHWYVITATNSCASAHRWLRDTLFPGESFAALDALATAAPRGSRGLLFHPYLNGERSPYWDPKLRADFVGLSFAHGRSEIVRALYEGIAYSLRDCTEVLRGRGLTFNTARITGGGARSATWRQIVADVLNATIELPATADASFGAALLAGVGIGVWPDPATAATQAVRIVARHEPDAEAVAAYDKGFALYRQAQAALAPVNHALVETAR
jgi:xylulokinase